MSTPIPPPEPDSAPTAEQPPVEDQPAAPPHAQAPVAGPQGVPPGAHPGMPGGPAYYPSPFVPRIREPWINPAKRSALVLVAVGLAIVLLAGGFIVGATVAHRHDRGHSMQMRPLPGRFGGYGMPGRVPYGFIPGRGMHLMPRLHQPGRVVPTALPTPAPTTSHR